MNFGSCVLVVLAIGLSVGPAVAGHRSHGVHHAASPHHFRAAQRSAERSRSSAIPPRDSSSEGKGAVADPSKGGSAMDGSRPTGIDKANGDDESLHARKSGKTAVATLGPGVSGKESADVPIDTRITVNQGHQTIRGFGKLQFRSSNFNGAAGSKRQHIVDRHQGIPIRPGDRRRNSIGAVVDHAKAVTEHRNAAGVAVLPPTSVGVESKANPVLPGTTVPVPNAVSSVGNAPISNSSPVTTQGNRRNGTAVAIVATTNGPSINGTGIIRPAPPIVAIGGPARVTPGVLSGNSFRPKHP